ncbi:zinc ribbon domain-containing protein [Gorillibacterium sp. sgz500922]|uniref:zinc ribbon domain-containing protein n=1 Tax=Gorillibacterium sp. sgz500922 TaxID=3446694 RepID=UPI003F674D0E
MIECPWCHHRVVLVDQLCPECRQEVLEDHLNPFEGEASEEGGLRLDEEWHDEERNDGRGALLLEEEIIERFRCAKCGHSACDVKEAAMTGTGLSKLFDIQHHHYLFVSCLNCGFVEVYDPGVLRGKPAGRLGTALDVLFGG